MCKANRRLLPLSFLLTFSVAAVAQQPPAPRQITLTDRKGTSQTSAAEQTSLGLPCPLGRSLTQQVRFGDYTLRAYRDANLEGCLRISKNGHLVFSQSGGEFRIARQFDRNSGVPVGTDLTGDGKPDAVVNEFSHGAHCCFTVRVFELGDQFKRIAQIDALHSADARFFDPKGDGSYLFEGNDWTFAYWRAGFADSPSPRIILRYREGKFRADYDLMRAPAPSPKEFAALVRSVKSNATWKEEKPLNCDDGCGVPVELWQNMLKLLYSGHSDLAWKLFDQSWIPARKDKAEFARDFCRQLQTSPYWNDLREELAPCPPR